MCSGYLPEARKAGTPFTDITVESLATLLPDRNTRILIYCNNNFSRAQRPFPSKMARASLNLSTFIALYTYGYRNVYELGPLVDIQQTILPLESFAQDPLLTLFDEPSGNAR